MSYFGKNIKKIRSIKKISQSEFAKVFDLSRASIGAYEEGRAEAKVDTIIQIAKHFSISVDDLLTKELTVNELYHFDVFEHSINKTGESQSGSGGIFIPYVSERTQKLYLEKHGENGFVPSLPSIKLPFTAQLILRAFEHSGNDMFYNNSGLHRGDLLICSITDTGKTKDSHIYAIVTEDGIIVRRVKKHDNSLTLLAENPGFSPIELSVSDVKEIWELHGVYSSILSIPEKLEERVNRLEEITGRLMDELQKVKEKG